MLDLWDCFIPLLKQADSIVCHRLPSMANALNTMFSFLGHDLKDVVSKITSGPFLDPTQNAKEMVSTLNHMYAHVHSLIAKLEQLSTNSQNLQGETVRCSWKTIVILCSYRNADFVRLLFFPLEHPMDMTILTSDVQRAEARKNLWELIAVYTTWMEEWKQQFFSEVMSNKPLFAF